jgi:hypothetical protein
VNEADFSNQFFRSDAVAPLPVPVGFFAKFTAWAGGDSLKDANPH